MPAMPEVEEEESTNVFKYNNNMSKQSIKGGKGWWIERPVQHMPAEIEQTRAK